MRLRKTSCLRIWSETVPLERFARAGNDASRALEVLAARDVRLLAAVRPWELSHVAAFLDAAAEAGVSAGLWPMLADADGRWASLENSVRYTDFARRVLDAAGDAPFAEMAVDLEPPFERVARWVAFRPRVSDVATSTWRAVSARAASWPRVSDVEPYQRLLADIAQRGAVSSAVAVPLVLLDAVGDRAARRSPWPAFQAALATPLDALPWDHVNLMLYTSLFEGWSPRAFARPLVDRRRAVRALSQLARRASARFGDRAGVSLGAVGTGALGNEPVYRDPSELAEDARVVRAAGIREISLLDLGGVIARPPAEAWLDALTDAS